jgi:hypothetical protein
MHFAVAFRNRGSMLHAASRPALMFLGLHLFFCLFQIAHLIYQIGYRDGTTHGLTCFPFRPNVNGGTGSTQSKERNF